MEGTGDSTSVPNTAIENDSNGSHLGRCTASVVQETQDSQHGAVCEQSSSSENPTAPTVSLEDDEAFARSLAESINNTKTLSFGGVGSYWETDQAQRSSSSQKVMRAKGQTVQQVPLNLEPSATDSTTTASDTSEPPLSALHQELLSLQMASGRRAKR